MSRPKDYFMVLDTETANTLEQPLVFDLGFTICDRNGNIYERESYVIGEIFWGEEFDLNNPDLMRESYYADRLPTYKIHLKLRDGQWECKSFWNVRKRVHELMKQYNVKAVCAYNASFDVNALNTTCRYLGNGVCRYFFPYGTDIYCIWHMACQTILLQKRFLKMAHAEGWEKESGNVLTNAETCYKYMTHNTDYEECHTALEDSLIETAILAKCFATHKRMDRGINRLCWRIPQKPYREVAQ